MIQTVHVVVSCTDRKTAAVPAYRRLRDIEDGAPENRVRSWWSRLAANGAEPLAARDMYAGAHWAAAKEIPDALEPTHRARAWVASAGYGLVGWDARLVAYSATFARGQLDSVARSVPDDTSFTSVIQQWWDTLSTLPGPVAGEPRSIQALVAADPSAAVLIVASPPYVHAMEGDLREACRFLCCPEQLVVISNGAKLARSWLANHLVPVDSRARSVVHANDVCINARVALELVRRLGAAPLDLRALRSLYDDMVRDVAVPQRLMGEPMSDEQLLTFLAEELTAAPGAGYSRLLRKLRGSGRSCEQSRFRGLYRRVNQTFGS